MTGLPLRLHARPPASKLRIRLADVADAVEVLDRAVHHCPMEEELWMRLHAEARQQRLKELERL